MLDNFILNKKKVRQIVLIDVLNILAETYRIYLFIYLGHGSDLFFSFGGHGSDFEVHK